jgi:AraC family transcriptional regulator
MHPAINSSRTDSDSSTMPVFVVSLIESAAASFEADPPASRACLLHAVAILRAQARQPQSQPTPRTRGQLPPWQAKRIVAHIEANLASALMVEDLAKLANMSTSHFFRAFKMTLGVSPCEYIMHRRLDQARAMIRNTAEPLSHIAIACGLCDQSHLCRVFRRLLGQTPGEWRRANPASDAHGARRPVLLL